MENDKRIYVILERFKDITIFIVKFTATCEDTFAQRGWNYRERTGGTAVSRPSFISYPVTESMRYLHPLGLLPPSARRKRVLVKEGAKTMIRPSHDKGTVTVIINKL